MCMMQTPHNRDIPTIKRREKEEKKHVVFNKEARMKPDPHFVDERKQVHDEGKKGFFDRLAELF